MWNFPALCGLFTLYLLHTANAKIHGGTFMAAVGRDSIVLAADSRQSSQATGPFMLNERPRRVFRVGDHTLVACFGLDSDVDALVHALREKLDLHCDSSIEPQNVARCVANILYVNRMICSPIVLGFGSQGPYICSMDGIGAQTVTHRFAVMGTASAALYAACEASFREGLGRAALGSLVEGCMQGTLARDVMSGCDVRLYTLTKSGAVSFRDVTTPDV